MFRIPSYLNGKENSITAAMRSILVDWMVEIQENFELNHETLYLAVKLTDIYLSRGKVDKDVLQLVGAAAVFIASKFDVRIAFKSKMWFTVVVFLGYTLIKT